MDLAPRIFALLTHGGEGGERYLLGDPARIEVRRMIDALGTGEALEAGLREIFRAAYVLDTKLGCTQAARALLELGLERGGAEVFGVQLGAGAIGEGTWRKLVGADRGLPKSGKQPKTGKFPWELIGDPQDD